MSEPFILWQLATELPEVVLDVKSFLHIAYYLSGTWETWKEYLRPYIHPTLFPTLPSLPGFVWIDPKWLMMRDVMAEEKKEGEGTIR